MHDIIIRYIRVRVDEGAANSSGDAIDMDECFNVIIDHVTASYSRDEGISCQEDSDHITVQWCIISESLTYEDHSYGSLVRGQFGQRKTYHHNLYAHNKGRNPRPGNYLASTLDRQGLYFDFRNNVMYNWSGNYAGYNDDTSTISRYNIIGNVFIRGPESGHSYGDVGFREKCKVGYGYFADNSYDGIVSANPWSIVYFAGMSDAEIAAYKNRSYRLPMEYVTTTSAAQAEADVLEKAGASFPKRDIIDTRIVNDVINKTGHSISTTEMQPEGAWPQLASIDAPQDNDHDGMPDIWEVLYGLDYHNPEDRNYYDLNNDYTNLEVYLNNLVGSMAPCVWNGTFGGSSNSNDYAVDIASDVRGNVFVTGYAKNAGTNYDIVTIKYHPDGTPLWSQSYNRTGSSNDYAQAVTIDNGSAIVAGYNYTSYYGYDAVILKYASLGSQIFKSVYNSAGTNDDKFFDVEADAEGNIYAVGITNHNWLIIKYASDGRILWTQTYNGSANAYDALYKVAVDGTGNVYVCGEVSQSSYGRNCAVAKYSSAGTQLWIRTYGDFDNDFLESMVLDNSGNVYVTGSMENYTDCDYVTLKYSANGQLLWDSYYDCIGWDEAIDIALSCDGDVVVTGYSFGENVDSATVKYDSETGEQVWVRRYNGSGNSTDYTEAIAADKFGNIFVHGKSCEIGSTDYITICYDLEGNIKWKNNYNGAASLSDLGLAMVVVERAEEIKSSVYVTGSSQVSGSNYDYLTLKYRAENSGVSYPCYTPPAGDLNADCKVTFEDCSLFAWNWLYTITGGIEQYMVAAWGDNEYGQAASLSGNEFVAVSAGTAHSLALKKDGTIVGWGLNDSEQNIPEGNDFKAVAASYSHSLALKNDGTIVGWGNPYCLEGLPDGNDFIAISSSGYHSLALRKNGTIAAWGDSANAWGQLDVPDSNDFKAIAAGWSYSVALKNDGSICAWGYNEEGETNVPAGNDYIAIAAYSLGGIALKSDGSIVRWGSNNYEPPAGNDFTAIAA
ncbi:MAG: Beta-propeller repeat protein [Planctomycetes bacterium ADurb.Bin401]|nr:MAG: Beta-propeller repeat protein [Planctomycetes bacterium ADurb.Bin401]